MKPLLSVVIPSIGKPGLESTLRSVRQQPDGDMVEIIVVGDTLDGPLPGVETLAMKYRACYIPHAGTAHCWGQEQRQAGMAHATGRWLSFLADDDIWYSGALAAIRSLVLHASRPQLFRVQHWIGRLIWDIPTLASGHIDANCIVTPNDPLRLGEWGMRYEGDFDFIAGTAARYDGVDWRPEVIGICRPTRAADWTAHLEVAV